MARKKVFLIDDDPDILEAFGLVLRRAGYQVFLFQKGSEMFESKEKPDIYLIDRYLSGSDGLDLCRHIKNVSDLQDIPVVIISATPNVKPLAAAAGANDFLEKPFRSKALLDIVAKYLSAS